MSKDKKHPAGGTAGEPRGEAAPPPLSPLEEEISLICLRYFRGDWDLYLDYLAGPRVAGPQRLREVPVVERLKEQDRRTDYLAALLEDEIVAAVAGLPFEGLYSIWEQCLILDPEADPFKDYEAERAELDDASAEPPASLH